ncbi:MAG: acetate/propionate family kinase [Pseudomonadota bacterium]
MEKCVLTLNAGSSSLKAALFGVTDDLRPEGPMARAEASGIGTEFARLELNRGEKRAQTPLRATELKGAFDELLGALIDDDTPIVGVGHRVVHGGRHHAGPVLVNNDVERSLQELAALAPQHQPFNLHGIKVARARFPSIPQVACFDTAFHRTQPDVAQRFALPRDLHDDGVLRYGFHGLSYAFIAEKAADLVGEAASSRMIVAHLGAGASLAALKDGKSVASTMGFTALDGLPMATRCGALDPGVLLHLLEDRGLSSAELRSLLYQKSGLLGVSGISGDMRKLLASEEPAAKEAVDLFVYRVAEEIGRLATVLQGLDVIVFTAGIGENAPPVRRGVIERLRWLGFELNDAANEANQPLITTPGRTPAAYVISTNEEEMLARGVLSVAGSS